MRAPEAGWLALALALGGGAVPAARAAAPGPWTVEAASEPSRVTLGARQVTWWSNRLQLGYRGASGSGWNLGLENQKRGQGSDQLLSAGAYGRRGDWLLSGQFSAGLHPAFLPRHALDVQLGRLFGPLALQAGLSYRSFEQARVRLGSLGATYYHGDSELEVKLSFGDSTPPRHHIRVASVRALWDTGTAFSVSAGVSAGRGLYDAINLPGIDGNRGWLVHAGLRCRISERDNVQLDLSYGREDPNFRQRAVGLAYRRAF